MAVPQERLRVTELPHAARLDTARIGWGGVWGGFLVGLGVLMLLSTLGLAVGVTTASFGQGEGAGARSLGIGAGIWAGLSLLLALLLAGMVSSRVSNVVDRTVATVHGVLVWVLTMLAVLYLAGAGIGLGMSGVLSAARDAGAAVTGSGGADAAGAQTPGAGAGERAAQAAQQAQPYASTATWTAFGAMVLGLVAAVVGAHWGARRTDDLVRP